jgi:hypothetical protein
MSETNRRKVVIEAANFFIEFKKTKLNLKLSLLLSQAMVFTSKLLQLIRTNGFEKTNRLTLFR